MPRATKTILLSVSFAVVSCGGSRAKQPATCPTGQHDGGKGVCVALGTCSRGYHDGGDGVCLPDVACAVGYHDGGDGKCTATGTCATGYRLASDGSCAKRTVCAAGTHDNGAGVCVPDATCPAGFHDGGIGTCVPVGACSSGYHDGGGGDCVLVATCSVGYHNGGTGTCVPLVACQAGFHDGGDGACVRDGQCSLGYHDGGDGRCLTLGNCSPGYHDGGDSECWLASQCSPGYSLDSSGGCVLRLPGTGGTSGSTTRSDAGPSGGGGVVGSGGLARDGGMGGGGAGGTVTFTLPTPVVCGDGKKEGNEGCDDGNTASNDGCSSFCSREAGYVCPMPGQPCVLAVGCGNAILTAEETCDDGNTSSADGCSADCGLIEDGYECRVPGQRCTPKCGDSKLIGREQCDDGNATGGDGCSSTCQVEPGADCAELGKPCLRGVCGNGKREAGEVCDCGTDDTNLPSGCRGVNGLFYGDGKGCSTTCTKEPTCQDASGKTQACTTSCGDGNIDPGEECDDGNLVSGDGCSNHCETESGFACASQTIQVSSTCQSSTGQCLQLPVIFRDFQPENVAAGGHPDFPFLGTRYGGSVSPTTICVPNASGPAKGMDATARCWGIVGDSLLGGKPQPGPTATCACQFSDWSIGNSSHISGGYTEADNDSPLSDGNGGYQGSGADAVVETISTAGAYTGVIKGYTSSTPSGPIWKGTVPTYRDAQSFNQWWKDDPAVNKTFYGVLELPAIGSNIYQYASAVHLASGGFFPLDLFNPSQAILCNLWPYWNRYGGGPIWSTCTGDQYLFPPRVIQSDCPNQNPLAFGCWVSGVRGFKHDFYFTEEVRYHFVYGGSSAISFLFYGDDDLFAFVNGVLVLDLGGIHAPLPGKVTLSGNPGDAQVVEGGCLDSAGNITGTSSGSTACSSTSGSAVRASDPDDFRVRTVKLGLEPGKVYELAIFGADRHPPESNFLLTLQGPTTRRSVCTPRCGDGVVSVSEECDCGDGSVPVSAGCAGPNDDATYGGCTSMCRFGPYCGDGHVNGPEECDLGKDNGATAPGADGCSRGCLKPLL